MRPLPEYPWFDDPEFVTWSKFCGPREAGAARFAENALDLAHLDFVHPGPLGSPGDTVIDPYDTPDQEFVDFLDVLLPQDQAIIESQRPHMVPVDLTEELHVKVADAGAIAYRRLLKDALGLVFV